MPDRSHSVRITLQYLLVERCMELARASSSSAMSFAMFMPIVFVFLPIGFVAIIYPFLFVKVYICRESPHTSLVKYTKNNRLISFTGSSVFVSLFACFKRSIGFGRDYYVVVIQKEKEAGGRGVCQRLEKRLFRLCCSGLSSESFRMPV